MKFATLALLGCASVNATITINDGLISEVAAKWG